MNLELSIHLRIEELALHGFAPGDQHQIGEAIERELSRLFAEQPTPPTLMKPANLDRLNGGEFQMTAAAKPEITGTQIAHAVFEGIGP